MVATHHARGPAVATVLLFLLVLIPVGPAQAQGQASDIFVTQGEAFWTQGTFGTGNRPTSFVNNGSSEVTLHVKVYNIGPAATNIPVYYWFNDAPDRTDCVKISIPQGSANAPGNTTATFTVASRPLGPGPWNVTVHAFPPAKPTAVEADEECSTPARPLGTDCVNPVNCRAEPATTNNVVRAFFVKEQYLDLHIRSIRMCPGDPDLQAECAPLLSSDGWYNTTPIVEPEEEGYGPTPVYFEVLVDNIATHPWSYANVSDYGGACGCAGSGFGYELNLSVTGPNIAGTRWLTDVAELTKRVASDPDEPELIAHRAWSTKLQLDGLAGNYTVTARLDPTGLVRRHGDDSSVDVMTDDRMQVAYRDFTGNFTASNFRTSASSPYPYDGLFTITGNLTLRNSGPAGLHKEGSTYVEPNVLIYLDNLSWTDPAGTVHTNTKFVKSLTYDVAGNFSEKHLDIFWEATNNPTSDRYLTPGKHVIHVRMDVDEDQTRHGDYLESNESNNNFTLDIYVQDSSVPVFRKAPKIAPATGFDLPAQNTFRPLEGFNIYADVHDDDINMRVVANLSHTYTENGTTQTAYREFNGTKATSAAFDGYVIQAFNMNFHNFSAVPFNGTENWTLRVRAIDSFNNNATSVAQPFYLKGWPIHNATADYIVVTPAAYPDATLLWNGPDEPTWVIRVEPNMTGFSGRTDHQQFNTANLAYNLTFEATGHTRNLNGSFWAPQTPLALNGTAGYPSPACEPSPSRTTRPGVPGFPTDTPSQCSDSNNTFKATFLRIESGAVPGIWNYSIRVTDIAGQVRVINGSLFLEDLKPVIHHANLSGVTEVSPPGTIRVRANVSDDNNEIAGVYVNLSRIQPGDDLRQNITIKRQDPEEAREGLSWFQFNESFEVGRFKSLGSGGVYNVSIEVVDNVGNWQRAGIPGNLTIKDEEAPQLVSYGVTPNVIEINENVTFWATATDATNVTMKLEIFKAAGSQELLVDPIFIEQSGTGPTFNYTRAFNFTTEAVYGWRLTAIDSVNKASTPATGSITVRDNLGPKYDVRGPSAVIDGTRYGSATPRIEVVVHDIEGVIASSIDMDVAGLAVDFEVSPAPGNLNGHLVTFNVPVAKKFVHGDLVHVNLSAKDNSPEQLTSAFAFSFVVDDIAPTARIVSMSPSYRDQPAHALNASLNTRITLAAEDLDGLPTQIPTGGIRYRILGGGPGAAETVYSGPFKINDAPGVYTGPRLYQIQFWAEDEVGNFNRNYNVTTVYVDDTPPALFQFFPQGRNINATFVDDRVGVNKSVVWYRVNDQAFVPLSLVEHEGTWTLTLPEGVKGDRISYYLQAWDRLDNTETFGNATNPYASFDVSNHEPKLKITAPVDGGRVSRTLELMWDASDEDGDALVFTVYYRAPGKTNFVELAKIENTATRKYNIDTLRYPDGIYTFRVAAGDGGFVKLAETTVTIINRVDPIGVVQVSGDGLPGSEMLITAEVTKAEANVEARLYLGNTLVNSYPMNDAGKDGDDIANDGIYSVRIAVEAAGDYRIEIYTQYREDGELKEQTISSAQTFIVKLTPAYILTQYGAIIALIGLLAAVGIGVGVFVVMRRR